MLNKSNINSEKKEKPSKLKIGLVMFTVLIVAIALFSGTDTDDATENNTAADNKIVAVESASYQLVEEQDTSYAGCKRVSYKVKIDPSSSDESIRAMQDGLIESNKAQWDDITIFTYSSENTDEAIKKSAYDIDIAEYSTCQ